MLARVGNGSELDACSAGGAVVVRMEWSRSETVDALSLRCGGMIILARDVDDDAAVLLAEARIEAAECGSVSGSDEDEDDMITPPHRAELAAQVRSFAVKE